MYYSVLIFLFLQFLYFQSCQTYVINNFENSIFFHWKGNLTSNSITMKIFKNIASSNLESKPFLLLYQKQNSEYVGIRKIWIDSEENPTTLYIDSLTPDTTYYYTFLVSNDGTILENFISNFRGLNHKEYSFKTFGKPFQPYSFNFSAASCAQSSSNHDVFRVIAEKNPQFFIHLGDFHYDDITENNTNAFYTAYYKSFLSNTQRELYTNVPITYVWDDHDYGGNDCEGDSITRDAATEAYKKFVPHYLTQHPYPLLSNRFEQLSTLNESSLLRKVFNRTLQRKTNSYGIYHSFIVGRTFFIVMDETSYRILSTHELLGSEQQVWLENQIYFASRKKEIEVVFLVSPLSWNSWAFNKFEKSKYFISDIVKKYLYPANKQVYMISGDAHMIGFDDGSNNDLAGFPTIQAGSLDSRPNCKGGPYSHGFFPGRGQYAFIQVEDDGEKVCLKINLNRMNETLIYYDTCNKSEKPEKAEVCI